MFLACLPKKFILDGAGLLTVLCGTAGPRDEVISNLLGCSSYIYEPFSFEVYAAASERQREEMVLCAIKDSLIAVGRAAGSDLYAIDDAANEVARRDFQMTEEVPKLAKTLRARRLKFKVYRHLSAKVGESWRLRVMDSQGLLLDDVPMVREPNYLDRCELFRRSRTEGDRYVVECRLGKVSFSYDVLPSVSTTGPN